MVYPGIPWSTMVVLMVLWLPPGARVVAALAPQGWDPSNLQPTQFPHRRDPRERQRTMSKQ